jgi:phosphopantothenoylcysteine decarboxylase/phosphopantothenate--cysteine ligase
MGFAIAEELQKRGALVTLITGPVNGLTPGSGIKLVSVTTAEEMCQAALVAFGTTDLAIMSAAVADYTPVVTAGKKIKKQDENFNIELKKTRDILKSLGEQKKAGQVLVGFALETENGSVYAKEKLKMKNADMIVLNSLSDPGAGFGHDTNKITIFDKSGDEIGFELKSKTAVAKDIVDTIIRKYYA